LIGDLFTARARWSAPALVTRHATLAFDHEAVLAALAALAAAVLLVVRRKQLDRSGAELAADWTLVAIAIVIALPWLAVADHQGLGFRLRIAAFVPLALLAAIAIGALPVREIIRDAWCSVVALGIVLVAAREPHTEGEIVTHPALVASAL